MKRQKTTIPCADCGLLPVENLGEVICGKCGLCEGPTGYVPDEVPLDSDGVWEVGGFNDPEDFALFGFSQLDFVDAANYAYTEVAGREDLTTRKARFEALMDGWAQWLGSHLEGGES